MSAAIVVPSDISILEAKNCIGVRSLSIVERMGLLGIAPMLHIRYSKMDRSDMKSVLTKQYDADSADKTVHLCRRRQESVRKYVVGHNGLWVGTSAFPMLAIWSFRRYNYQAKLITVPFLAYAGSFAGRWVGDILTGRNKEFGRDRFLGEMPAKVYYKEE